VSKVLDGSVEQLLQLIEETTRAIGASPLAVSNEWSRTSSHTACIAYVGAAPVMFFRTIMVESHGISPAKRDFARKDVAIARAWNNVQSATGRYERSLAGIGDDLPMSIAQRSKHRPCFDE